MVPQLRTSFVERPVQSSASYICLTPKAQNFIQTLAEPYRAQLRPPESILSLKFILHLQSIMSQKRYWNNFAFASAILSWTRWPCILYPFHVILLNNTRWNIPQGPTLPRLPLPKSRASSTYATILIDPSPLFQPHTLWFFDILPPPVKPSRTARLHP